LNAREAIAAVDSDADKGLSFEEAGRRLERFGANALQEPAARSTLSVFVGQFKSPLIYLLMGAACIALALGHRSDAIVIVIVVLLNAFIGSFQEGRAERSLEALRKLASRKTRLERGGRALVVDAREVVPGDILLVDAGDAVAADARLLHVAALHVAEAALTGESVPVAKTLAPLPRDTLLADRTNMLYAGTHVAAGRARAVVVATGIATEVGLIAGLAEATEQPRTPLERRVDQFGRYIMAAAAVIFVAVIVVGVLRGVPFGEIVMIGISQVVGVIPEGLPVAMTIALAVGVQRMARRKAVVRRLAAVETLGATTVVCSDKTGTLTRNEMTVTALCLPDGREIAVTGAGYDPEGVFLENGRELDDAGVKGLRDLLEAAVLCNDARLQGPEESVPRWKPIGDPTEVALLTLAMKGGLVPSEVRKRFPRRAEIPFDASAKLMATEHQTTLGPRIIVKGAPEVLLGLCDKARRNGEDVTLNDDARRAILEAAGQLAERALRVLSLGVVDGAELDGRAGFTALRGQVTLIGSLGQIDPPRSEVRDAVQRCRDAGIRTVMVTGDHKATGRAVAEALGIARPGDLVIDGRELEQMSDAELSRRIRDVSVFARVHPAQKLRIVDHYQRQGEIVAMTGDGVNDAPALVKADVGVAMGMTGTEVAKEAAKIVIGDDNFTTIVGAVEEGRVVYWNIKKAVLLLVSTSLAEVLVLLLAMLMGYAPPFAAVQILWNNLVTEGLIVVNLVMDPAEGDEMTRSPVSHDEPLLTRVQLTRMAFMVPAILVSTLGWFVLRGAAGVPEAQVRTETFTLLAICEWFNLLNCRSERKSALSLGILKNRWLFAGLALGNVLQGAVVFWKPLGRVFHTVPFSVVQVGALGAVGSLVLWVEELRKLIVRRRELRKTAAP
jgi:Ca2+-transporting ATPase